MSVCLNREELRAQGGNFKGREASTQEAVEAPRRRRRACRVCRCRRGTIVGERRLGRKRSGGGGEGDFGGKFLGGEAVRDGAMDIESLLPGERAYAFAGAL